ncbi:MAG: hypothetical protein Q9196_001839 [Gyalolechia fulgens]
MRGGVHDTFREITIHTAKCDICNKHNTSKMYRCEKCGRQCCSPCWEKKGGDGRHQLHNKDNLTYKGERAPDLPPKQDPTTVKTEASPSSLGSGRKRNREATTPVSPVARVGAYAPTTPPKSAGQSEGSESKRRRQSNVDTASTKKEASFIAESGPILKADMPKSSIKQHEPHENMSGADLEYDLDVAVNNLIDAAGSDTESETPDCSKDRKGLDSIVEAIDIVERSSSPQPACLPAAPASNHPSKVTANHGVQTPRRIQPWTPANAGYTWPGRTVKAPKHSGLPSLPLGASTLQPPAILYPLVLGPGHHSRHLFDGGEEGGNEQAGLLGGKIIRGPVTNGVPRAPPAGKGTNRLAKDWARTKQSNGTSGSASTKAVILVGGPSRGTRFRPLSLDVPKPLFDVAGHPILWHCLQAVARVPNIKEVILVGYYDESVFRDFIKDSARELPQIRMQYLREYQALGTAGGLYHFRDVILKGKPDRFFVLNADVCCSFPLSDMLKLFEEKDAEAVILGTRVSNDAASNFGCIVSDAHTKRVLHYVEKPESHISNLINCGVYLFSTETIFPSIRSAIKRRSDRPRMVSYPSSENLDAYVSSMQLEDGEKNEVLRLEQDILSDLADSKQFYVLETKDFWRQIKTAGSAVPANALYLQKALQSQSEELAAPSANIIPPVFIDRTAEVDPTAKLGPHVSIGPRVIIGPGVRVKESIVLEDAQIKHDACVLYSIIGWNSRVGAWARVEGEPTPVGSHTTSIVKNGVKVQSITILGKDCGVGDEVRVQNCVCLPNKELKRDVTNEVIM